MKVILGVNLYDVFEVAEMLSVSKTTVHNYVKAGRLDAQKIGGKLHFTEESIKSFINGSNIKRIGENV